MTTRCAMCYTSPMFKSARRDRQRLKERMTRTTSRAFLHTLDRLAAQRDRAKLNPKERT